MLKPIRSEADYEANLSRLEALWTPHRARLRATNWRSSPRSSSATKMTAFQSRPPLPSLQSGFAWSSRIVASRPRAVHRLESPRLRGPKRARALSIDMNRALNQGLGIPAEFLSGPTPSPKGGR